MLNTRLDRSHSVLAGTWTVVAALVAAVALAGCQQKAAMITAPAQAPGQPAADQRLFAGDTDAVQGMLEALKIEDRDKRREAMRGIFGPALKDLVSGDSAADAANFRAFVTRAAEKTRLEGKTNTTSVLLIGNEEWPFPIPIVKADDGKWFFDTATGKEEILARRIGANELAAIQVCRAYVQAQRQYASKDRDGSEVLKYAQHFRSTPGHKNGLYWKAPPGEEQSPLGPLVAEASLKGYFAKRKPGDPGGPRPFQGYYFHILTRQGPAAPGGRYNYVINGNMIAGFALVAWPAKYGSSGVMTFLVSHQGKVYQKDLGPDTQQLARQITEYNPDATCKLVTD